MKSYLYGLTFAMITVFTACNQTPDKATQPVPDVSAASTLNTRIVYVNQDSLLEKYDLYQDNKKELEEDSKRAQNSISSKLESFQRKIEKFQRKVYETQQKAPTLAPIELQRLEQEFAKEQESLAKEEESLVKQRDNAAIELENKIFDLQITLKNKVDEYLAELATEKGYDYVLIKGNGGGVLYGNPDLDITDAVVTILNERYGEGKK